MVSDMVVASPSASFGLPETSVGVYAAAGGLARIMRSCGLQMASQIALTGKRLAAREAHSLRLVNSISKTQDSLIEEALALASSITDKSPDATIVSRSGLREAWETASVERATQITADRYEDQLLVTPNRSLGLRAFRDKTTPKWFDSKL